ncbi:hypothetical protein KGF56_003376 [Candida oxycetoniae]|uniref:Karyogamy protein KAR4 n=1 Tax=Candida oxycetoniae TaxID=497107 RepID=A0AAI9SVG6_9ASCO|nr:uncharacterized protein KGF56_003376 [Candida oxycetoniae]KAI3403816.2 hypothetical protein KGF56_003376 [Candida oxycetoniae]
MMYTYNKFGSRTSTTPSNSSVSKPTVSRISSRQNSKHKSFEKDRERDKEKEKEKDKDKEKEKEKSERERKNETIGTDTTTTTTTQQINYTNHYIHTGEYSTKFIRNVANPLDGYPKLDKLHQLKRNQILKHATKAYGVRCSTEKIVPTVNNWIDRYNLKFDVIMIGALADNQLILPVLNKLPIYKLCSKPGFLFIWSTTQKIQELTKLLNNENFNKKFRRSEELIFLPVDDKSPYYPKQTDSAFEKSILKKQQWHCWMCITGTVRRSSDNDLIHCNIDTDLQIESPGSNGTSPASPQGRNACPEQIYKVAENFSNSNRRLHLIPSHLGFDTHIKLRPGWVIMGPDVWINNFDPQKYYEELGNKSFVKYKQVNAAGGSNCISTQYLVPQSNEIEDLRPKSPIITTKSG